MDTYVVIVPLRGEQTYLVPAKSKADAMRKVEQLSDEAEGLDYDIHRSGKPKAAWKDGSSAALCVGLNALVSDCGEPHDQVDY